MYYTLSSDSENFRNYILPKNISSEESVKIYESFNATPCEDNYQPLNFVMTKKSEIEFPIADYCAGYLPICSEKK